MKIVIACLGLLSLIYAAAPVDTKAEDKLVRTSLATIMKVEGIAKIQPELSIKRFSAQAGDKLFEGDQLSTGAGSTVVVELEDDSKIVVNENSELSFMDMQNLEQGSGEVFYKIQKRVSSQGLKIKTPFSIIGIKGTEFIVTAAEDAEIALNEGVVGIESLRAEFELHKKKLMQEFEAFKDKQIQEFEAYKTQTEVVSYVKEFDLESNKVLRFSDASACEKDCERHVSEDVFTQQTHKRFEIYNAIIKD